MAQNVKESNGIETDVYLCTSVYSNKSTSETYIKSIFVPQNTFETYIKPIFVPRVHERKIHIPMYFGQCQRFKTYVKKIKT